MRLNTRGRYGIQLMAQLACHGSPSQPLGLRSVAAVTGLPWRYLEQIVRPLRRAALVTGRAGRAGGYALTRVPDRITLRDVIESTSGPVCLMDCVDKPGLCAHSGTCASRQVWLAVTEDIRAVLAGYSLCDLARRPCAGCQAAVESARAARTSQRARQGGRAKPGAAPCAAAIRRGQRISRNRLEDGSGPGRAGRARKGR